MLTRLASRAFALTFVALVGLAGLAGTGRAEPLSVEQIDNPRMSHDGWVTDKAQLLGSRAVEIEARLGALQRDTGAEVALVTLPSIGEASPKVFVTDLFNHWKIGRAGQDDGLLILHVVDQRRIEIETGYGSEGALPDAKCAWLINDVAVPRFRAGDFPGGHAALVQGVDYAIRHPGTGHDELIAAAHGRSSASPVGANAQGRASSQNTSATSELHAAEQGFVHNLVRHLDAPLLVGLVLTLLVWPVRRAAYLALHPNPKRRSPTPWGGLVFGVGCALGLTLLSALSGEVALKYLGNASLALTGALVGWAALRDKRRATLRFTPRSCDACQAQMSLVRDGKEEQYLPAGQRVEERIGAVDYDVWRCACGATKVEEHATANGATKCLACGFRTERAKRDKIVRAATARKEGLAKRSFECAHCKARRTEQITLPRKRPRSPSLSSSSASAGTSSSGSSSGGSSGGSFGGGGSGGGGAGGSY